MRPDGGSRTGAAALDRTPPDGLAALAVATAIGSAGMAAGGTAGALLAADITGTTSVAGLPVAALILGSAGAAMPLSRLAAGGRRGRGLALGYLLGAAGAATVIVAAAGRSLPLLLGGSAVLGAGNSAVFLTRYAAADCSQPAGRGRALGTVLLAITAGAVLSPVLLGPSGTVAQAVGLPRYAGLYLVALVAFGAAAVMFAAASHPGTPWLGRAAGALARHRAPGRAAGPSVDHRAGRAAGRVDRAAGRAGRPPLHAALRTPGMVPAVVAFAMANFIMVGTMAVAPVHLMAHGHGLGLAGTVIALHVAGMFAPAPITGQLADRHGPIPVVLTGGLLLLAASLAGTLVDPHHAPTMAAYLTVLGVGWNFGVVGGSALLTAAAPIDVRPHMEGVGEVAMGLAAAAAAPISGLVMAAGGYGAYSLASAAVAAASLLVIRRYRRQPPPRRGPAR
jgi:MFS family permease